MKKVANTKGKPGKSKSKIQQEQKLKMGKKSTAKKPAKKKKY